MAWNWNIEIEPSLKAFYNVMLNLSIYYHIMSKLFLLMKPMLQICAKPIMDDGVEYVTYDLGTFGSLTKEQQWKASQIMLQ